MFGPILGALTGIIGAVMQGSAQKQQQDLQWQALQDQKQNEAQQYDLSTADRIDANGNVVHYNKALNKWETVLTPTQQQLQSALEREQTQALTVDAPLKRKELLAQDKRSQEAAKEYEDLLQQYRNFPPKSEGAYADEYTTDALFSSQDKLRKGGEDIARLAVRSGHDPSALSGIVKAVADQQGAGIGDALLAGKQAGSAAHKGAEQIYQSQLEPLKLFAGITDDVGAGAPIPGGPGASVTGMQRDMESAISQALANAGNQSASAYSSLASSLGQSPDLSSIANSLAQMKLDSGSGFSAPIVGGGSTGTGSTGIFSGYNGGQNIWDPYGSGYSVGSRTGEKTPVENPFDQFTIGSGNNNFSWNG